MPPDRYLYKVLLETADGLLLENGTDLVVLETGSLTLVNYQFVRAGDGMSVTEKIR